MKFAELTRVEITKDHIRMGQRGSNSTCPIALAVRDATGKCIRVEFDKIECDYDTMSTTWLAFFKAAFFDLFGVMSPFHIRIPTSWLKKEEPKPVASPVYGSYKLVGGPIQESIVLEV